MARAMTFRRARAGLLALAATAVTACFGAVPAQAGLLVKSAPDCDSPDSAQVFQPWGDSANYFLAPDGGLEQGGAGWDLDGASVVAGNESFAVSGDGSSALDLPHGSSATSPAVCVGLENPTMRFFVRKTGDTGLLPALNTLRVDVMIEDNLGVISSLPIGLVSASGEWKPSPRVPVVANLLALLPGAHTPVAFRFVPQGGDWQVDDVYVDPYGGH
jgi:hypothetical protein